MLSLLAASLVSLSPCSGGCNYKDIRLDDNILHLVEVNYAAKSSLDMLLGLLHKFPGDFKYAKISKGDYPSFPGNPEPRGYNFRRPQFSEGQSIEIFIEWDLGKIKGESIKLNQTGAPFMHSWNIWYKFEF